MLVGKLVLTLPCCESRIRSALPKSCPAKPMSTGLRYMLTITMLLTLGSREVLAQAEPCILRDSGRKALPAAGAAQIAVILVDFPGIPTTYSQSDVTNTLRERQPGSPFSAFDVFRISSRGRYTMDFGTRPNGKPAVFGPYLVGRSTSEQCSKQYSTWSREAAALAVTDGYKRRRYAHTVFIFPPREALSCGLTGVGEIGGDTTWLFGLSANSFTHEIGHNLGLFHSGRRDQPGMAGQYGDLSSPMGAFQQPTLLFSAPHQIQLGWLPKSEQRTIAAGKPIRPKIYALERRLGETQPRVVSVPLPDGSAYRLSYRQELPDAPSPRSREYVRGVTIHRDFGLGLTSKLIGILRDGESFIDEYNNITVTQVSHDANTVTFDLGTAEPPPGLGKMCLLVDPCSVETERRTPKARDCRGFVAARNPLDFSQSNRCPTRAQGEDYDEDGTADTASQTADADGDGVPNEEDCNPTSGAHYRFYRYSDIDGDGAYESLLPPNQGVCAALSAPTGYVDEAPRDSCTSVADPGQTDNDSDGIGDVCQDNDPLRASRRRIVPSAQQLARAATKLQSLKPTGATFVALTRATRVAAQQFLDRYGAEDALPATEKTAIIKAAALLGKNRQEVRGARQLAALMGKLTSS